jgi:hypothetical protein
VDQGEDARLNEATENLFGPHSPRERLQTRTADGPTVEPITVTADGAAQEKNKSGIEKKGESPGEAAPMSPLDAFIVRCSAPMAMALLPNPIEVVPAATTTSKTVVAEKIKRSRQLTAKPTAGWSAMEKVKFVLLRKSGMAEEGEILTKDDLHKYSEIYKKPLSQHFIEAVSALVEATSPNKKKDHGADAQIGAILAV